MNNQSESSLKARTLKRSSSGRWIGGVCRGISERWNLPVGRVRALFGVASAVAGLGVVVYAACVVVLPVAGTPQRESALLRVAGSMAMAVAAVIGLALLAAAGATATVFGFGWAVVVVATVFTFVALAAWPRLSPAWAILPLVALLLPGVAVAVSDFEIEPRTGVEIVSPQKIEDIPESGFNGGLGDLLVDLRGFRAPDRSVVRVPIVAGTKQTVVALPHDRCFNLRVRYLSVVPGFGQYVNAVDLYDDTYGASVRVFDQQGTPFRSGRWIRRSADPAAPTLDISYRGIGASLTVRDYPSFVGPLYDTTWPSNVFPPASPDALRWAWRYERRERSKAVDRRWRAWEKRVDRNDERVADLSRGYCASEKAVS